jgi:hypothetical protein
MERTRGTNHPKSHTGIWDKNRELLGQPRWGGRDSNPRPMDYEITGRSRSFAISIDDGRLTSNNDEVTDTDELLTIH